MITLFRYTNAQSGATYDLNNDIAPFTDLDISVNQRTDRSRKRMQQHGIWPTYTYRDEMEIHIEGDLLANDSSDYVTKRLALVAALFANPNTYPVPTYRKDGSLIITMSGMGENLLCDVGIDAFSAPQTGGYPAYSKYLITFFNPFPWFIGATSGNKYYWS